MRTYRAKLSCINCGMEEFYKLPFRADIKSYRYSEEDDEKFSRYELEDTEHELNCMNCGLPYLTGNNFWEPSNLYGLRQSDGRGTASSAT